MRGGWWREAAKRHRVEAGEIQASGASRGGGRQRPRLPARAPALPTVFLRDFGWPTRLRMPGRRGGCGGAEVERRREGAVRRRVGGRGVAMDWRATKFTTADLPPGGTVVGCGGWHRREGRGPEGKTAVAPSRDGAREVSLALGISSAWPSQKRARRLCYRRLRLAGHGGRDVARKKGVPGGQASYHGRRGGIERRSRAFVANRVSTWRCKEGRRPAGGAEREHGEDGVSADTRKRGWEGQKACAYASCAVSETAR